MDSPRLGSCPDGVRPINTKLDCGSELAPRSQLLLLWHRHRMVQMRTRIMNQYVVALNEGVRRKKALWRPEGAQLESLVRGQFFPIFGTRPRKSDSCDPRETRVHIFLSR